VEVAGQRECRPLDGAAPLAVFEAVEQHKLKPLPGQPFELATWSRGKVGPALEAACAKALAAGDPSYRTIKGILAATAVGEPAGQAERSRGSDAAAYLRGPDALFGDLTDSATGIEKVVTLRPRSRASIRSATPGPDPLR